MLKFSYSNRYCLITYVPYQTWKMWRLPVSWWFGLAGGLRKPTWVYLRVCGFEITFNKY